jgi:hypothetical protein
MSIAAILRRFQVGPARRRWRPVAYISRSREPLLALAGTICHPSVYVAAAGARLHYLTGLCFHGWPASKRATSICAESVPLQSERGFSPRSEPSCIAGCKLAGRSRGA